MVTPNGIDLSPDKKPLYVAETWTGRLWAFDIETLGKLKKRPFPSPRGGWLVGNTTGFRNFDSLAVEADGRICVGTPMNDGITVMTPDGSEIEHVDAPNAWYTTNICFGGADMKTACITESWHSTLIPCDWPRAGLPLNFLNK